RGGQVEEAADGEVAALPHPLELDQGGAAPDDPNQQHPIFLAGPLPVGQLLEDEELRRRGVRYLRRPRGPPPGRAPPLRLQLAFPLGHFHGACSYRLSADFCSSGLKSSRRRISDGKRVRLRSST